MYKRIFYLLLIAAISGSLFMVGGQVDSVVGQVTSSPGNSFAGGVSANGRLIVFQSRGNLATVNPRNEDNNDEIFLFDYAQRRIFQITNTKAALNDLDLPVLPSNTFVDITNFRPVISADGRWIAFGSNATTSVAGSPADGTNPGNFNANDFSTFDAGDPDDPDDDTVENPLSLDANMEIWLYMVPALAPADLSSGDEIPLTDLSAGTFTQVTNTLAAIPPVPGSATQAPLISSDNRIPSISDDGSLTAFVSNRDLVGTGNAAPEDNPEIFVYSRPGSSISQVTQTPRGAISLPITNSVPTIAGNGSRIVFSSNGDNPVVGMTGGDNTDANREVFYTDLDPTGAPTGTKRQVTTTTPDNPGTVVNQVGFGRRMSRDGNLIVFDSYADLANEHGGANQPGFATYLFDVSADTFRRIAARSDADALASGGDIERFPEFTDYVAGVPQTLLMETRMNIAPDGTVPSDPEDGLNNVAARAAQVYSYPLNVPAESARFTRITKLPPPPFMLGTIQILASDSSSRFAINLPGSETGTGNPDLSTEVYYILRPGVVRETPASFSYSTGATRIPVQNGPLETGDAVTASNDKKGKKVRLGGTPTPTPTATPESTPAAVQGLSPGMLAFLNYTSGLNRQVIARTAVGGIDRAFPLPIELSGVTMTINGAAVGLKRVGQREILFVVPKGLVNDLDNPYPVVINNNGTVLRGELTISALRPDIFRTVENPAANRARALNVTNRVFTTEPFTITTFRLRGSRRVPSVIRVFATGIANALGSQTSIRVGEFATPLEISDAVEFEPGVYYIDFELSPNMAGAGDQPLVISILTSAGGFASRLEADAPRIRVL